MSSASNTGHLSFLLTLELIQVIQDLSDYAWRDVLVVVSTHSQILYYLTLGSKKFPRTAPPLLCRVIPLLTLEYTWLTPLESLV